MAKVSTQLRFDEVFYEKAKIIADRELRSINAQIEYFVKKGIESYEKENGTVILSEDA